MIYFKREEMKNKPSIKGNIFSLVLNKWDMKCQKRYWSHCSFYILSLIRSYQVTEDAHPSENQRALTEQWKEFPEEKGLFSLENL